MPFLQGVGCVDDGETVDRRVEVTDVRGIIVVKVVGEGWKVEKVVPGDVNVGKSETANALVSDLKVENVDDMVEISGRIVEAGNCGSGSSVLVVANVDAILDISGRKVENVD